ncbi:hypothetical protein GGQ88_002913 [Novosphingobium hassiacum]|uniref:Uncharacterized protein n=1 Tax=Novosphingobium hassiacum TaxID=173676 RepID=A0A7W5ZX74_9SPHN|nr:hypothetical protein [Novosphingobium hassiacum]MBB3861625.1 hypothetical protein [Novosphingobium hassiacum]
MSGRAGPALIAALWLALAGCDRDPAPVPAPSARPHPAVAASAAPAPEPSESPSAQPAAEPSVAAAQTYPPRNDCSTALGWPAFYKALTTAVRARDATGLAALASPDITLDYGGGSGVEELKKRLAEPERKLWAELDAIMPLGCAVQGGLAAMPWVFWNIPDDIDGYSAMLVTGDAVELLDGPKGKPLAMVGWQLVGIDPMEFRPDKPTTKVTLRDARKGWIATARLRSLLDYRVIAEPKDNGWQITAFIAGD